MDIKSGIWAKVLTLKPQGWNFDIGIKASTRGFKLGFESGGWGGKEEAGDEGKGGEIFLFASASPPN